MYFQLVSLIWARQCTLPPVPVVGRLYAQDEVEAGYHCLPGREVCSRNAHNRQESYIPHVFHSAQIHVASSSLQTLRLKAPSVCYICKHSCF